MEGEKKIAIYHSPNQGGNEHVSLDNSLTDDWTYCQDEQGEVYQEQTKSNWMPYIVGGLGAIALIGGLVYFLLRKNNKKE